MSNGGGIRNWLRGTVNIYNSEISLNSASLSGGGIHNAKISFLNNPLHNGDDSTINIEDTTFNQNSAQHGGGVWNSGTVGIRRSTFEANTMSAFGQGGGIHNSGFLYLINSTLFGNGSGFSGGGLYNEGTAQLGFATFSANSATAGASVQTGGGVTTFSGVFIGGDINGACNFVGTIGYVGNNIDVDGSCGDFTTEPNPMLAGYGHHGGATKTVALSSDSPLIDAGIEKACFGVDQRNLVRPVDGNDPDTVAECDIGAFEWGATASPTAVKLTGQRVKLASLNQFMIVLLLITTAFTLFYKSNSLAFVAAHLPSANRTSK